MKQASEVATKVLAPIALGLLIPFAALTNPGCKKDEPPPPLPSAAPATTPTPTAPVELVPEAIPVDAGADADDGGKKVGTGSGSGLKKCCVALRQNAKSAPPPNNMYMESAANTCDMMVGAGQGAPAIQAAIQGMLKGAGMPASCK